MPNLNWSKLSSLQLGRYAEYYAKMELASYGLEVYTSEVDDHGIDFVAKTKSGRFLEIQVKSVRQNNYVFLQKEKWNIENENLYLALLLFEEGKLPDVCLIPAKAWRTTNALFCDKDYKGLKSKPEYGLNLSRKNIHLLLEFELEAVIAGMIF